MKKKIALIVAVLAVVILFAVLYRSRVQEEKPRNLAGQVSKLSHSLDSRLLPTELWTVADYGIFINPDGTMQQDMSTIVQSRYRELKEHIKLYSGIPEAQGLQALLDESFVGTLIGGGDGEFKFNFINTRPADVNINEMKAGLKVVFFGADQSQKALKVRTIAARYYSEQDALLIPCIKFAHSAFGDALVFHELKHAQQERQMKMFGVTVHDSDDNLGDISVDHEVEANHLAGEILNVGTKGGYYQRLRQIITRRKATTAQDLIMKLTEQDMVYIDELFGKAGGIEAGLRRFGYWFHLGYVWITDNVPVEKRVDTAREFYKQLYYANPK